jgi:hypothetical protein
MIKFISALSGIIIAAVVIGPAFSQGFSVRDLRTTEGEAKAALDPRYVARAQADRLILTCTQCQGAPMIDIKVGRQDDGTEGRFRSGQTTIAQLEAQCRARSSSCRLTAISLAPAVGWVSSYSMGNMAGATAVILRDGDMLTMRVITNSPALSTQLVEKLVGSVGRRVVGQ